MKPTWATKIQELQREPGARSEFETHVHDLRKAATQRTRDLAAGIDHVQQNIVSARALNSQLKAFELHKRALQNCARQDAASNRRSEQSKPIASIERREKLVVDKLRIGHKSIHKIAQQPQLMT